MTIDEMATTTSTAAQRVQQQLQQKHFSFDRNFQEKRFYVYVDWTLENQPRVFYVGYGGKNRISRIRRNKHHDNIVKKYGLRRQIVFETADDNVAKRIEIKLIQNYKTFVFSKNYVFGTNYTAGGDGQAGRTGKPLSRRHKQILSEVNSHPKSKKTKLLMKKAAQKRANEPSWRQKMSEVSILRWQNKKYRAKLHKAVIGKKRTLEQRQRIARALKKSWLNKKTPEDRARSGNLRFSNPEERKKAAARMCLLWSSLTYRKNRKKIYKKKSNG